MRTNCPNCGAPYDATEAACPYCKTAYVDFTNIPTDRPFLARFGIDTGNGERTILVSWVRVTNLNIETDTDVAEYRTGGDIVRTVVRGYHVHYELGLDDVQVYDEKR